MLTANPEGLIELEGGVGSVSVRRLFGCLQIDMGSSAFAVGMLRDIGEKNTSTRVRSGKDWTSTTCNKHTERMQHAPTMHAAGMQHRY